MLGDAYFAQGSFTAALKSYQKCVELNPESLYAMLQISIIKQVLLVNLELYSFAEISNDQICNLRSE